MKRIVQLLFIFIPFISVAQKRGNIWCFGDSALIDFSDTANILVGSCGLDTRGSCISMSNEDGKLLFYSHTRANMGGPTGQIFDTSNYIMQNGDSVIGEAWYQELVTIPNPANDSTYYLFSIGVIGLTQYGLYYSLIDMWANGGLGAVAQKNIQLQSFEQVDCLNAIKHGNGRDWWIIFRRSEASTGGSNNEWYTYLVTPDSIQNFSVQSIGSQNRTNNGHICFSPLGNKLVYINLTGIVELFDFDRCTGLLSNPVTIEQGPGFPPFPFTWGCAFSSNASKLYVTTNDTLSFLYQYDLNAANITASKDTLWSTNYPPYTCGGLKLAPNNKIYLSNVYYTQSVLYYPYADSMYNMYNMNLSVINQPDSLGAACNFQPYSFYLGGKRTYLGLPNNPDYDLGCDTTGNCPCLVGVEENPLNNIAAALFVSYISEWQKLFVNAQNIKGRNCVLQIFDVNGRMVFSSEKKTEPPYFTMDINCAAFAKGMYVISLTTEKEKLVKKFVKE